MRQGTAGSAAACKIRKAVCAENRKVLQPKPYTNPSQFCTVRKRKKADYSRKHKSHHPNARAAQSDTDKIPACAGHKIF